MEQPAVKRWIEFLEADAKKWEAAAQICDEQAVDLDNEEWTHRAAGFRRNAKECRDMIAEF